MDINLDNITNNLDKKYKCLKLNYQQLNIYVLSKQSKMNNETISNNNNNKKSEEGIYYE